MKTLEKCEICGNDSFKFLFKQKDKNMGFDQKFSLFACKSCDSIFLNPVLSYQELEKYYSSGRYYSLEKIKNKNNSKKIKFKLMLYKIYFDFKKRHIFKRFIFSPLKFNLQGTIIDKNKRLLDIGCGSGQFLYEMQVLGLNVQGIEPGNFDQEGNKKYKLRIKKSDLINTNYPRESFHIITMNHVLEHLNKPQENIKEVYRILKKDGIFMVAVPNNRSLAYKIFGKNWHQLDVPRHLINYSDKSLKILLEKNGFKILNVRFNSRPNQFVVSLYFLLGIKKRAGLLTRFLELLFLPLTWLVNSTKQGDQIEVWCSKK